MQFGPHEDFDAYPRTLETDCKALTNHPCDAVFAPTVREVYPKGVNTEIDLPSLTTILCGHHRPGHFKGVATVVAKLLNIVQPDVAVFGNKDYQQLQVIQTMVADLLIPVTVVGADTTREPNGLAMSSRNAYLSAEEKAQIINQLNNLNSLEFTFNQIINDKIEKGSCLLEFPGKLKCDYFDDKRKELIINKKKLAITQKRYNKTYYYPISKSPFLNILYKDKLLEIVKSGKLELSDQIIKLIYFDENEITVFFDKKTLDLKGWQIIDQYNNNINFSLNIVAKNDIFKKGTFKIPEMN